MQDISCFVSPEYHPIQNRINLFFLGIRVKNFFSSKKNFFKWYSIDISKALFYLFLSLFLAHLVRMLFFQKPKIKTSFLNVSNQIVSYNPDLINQASDEAKTQLLVASESSLIITPSSIPPVPTNTPTTTVVPFPTPTLELTPTPTMPKTTNPTNPDTSSFDFSSYYKFNNQIDTFYQNSILGWSFAYPKNLNLNIYQDQQNLWLKKDNLQILIRPVTINSPHAFVNDLATKKPTSEELKRYYEDKDYSNWLNRSLSLMRQKFLDLTKKGEVAGLVRRDHQEKQASEIYPNITLIKTNRDQNFEFVFFKENSYPSLSDQEWFYQIFFSFNQN